MASQCTTDSWGPRKIFRRPDLRGSFKNKWQSFFCVEYHVPAGVQVFLTLSGSRCIKLSCSSLLRYWAMPTCLKIIIVCASVWIVLSSADIANTYYGGPIHYSGYPSTDLGTDWQGCMPHFSPVPQIFTPVNWQLRSNRTPSQTLRSTLAVALRGHTYPARK